MGTDVKLIEKTISEYKDRFGDSPEWLVAAPGRVNLIGEHTDYNDGFVFPMGIGRYTVIAAGSRPESDLSLIYSGNMHKEAELKMSGEILPEEEVNWYSYVQGTIACCLEKGLTASPFKAVLFSDVPLGGGLSSSASLEVATATLLEAISGNKIDPVEKALACQQAEHRFAKMPCGIMDQFISAMAEEGRAMLLDCRSRTARMIPLASPDILVMITNSNVKHALTGSEYPERRKCCEEASALLEITALRDATLAMLDAKKEKLDAINKNYYRRARHVISENERTLKTADALTQNNWELAGKLMYESHDSLRDDYEVSCPEIDVLVEIARSIGIQGGVYGSRITGGGFGGCTVSLIKKDEYQSIKERVEKDYIERTGIEPTIFATPASQGAHFIEN